jgi:hypothetical protein
VAGAWARCPSVVEAWQLGRLCEEFRATPVQMLAELRNDPEQWAVQIAELRGYARAKAALDAARSDDDLDQRDPFVRRVKRTMAAMLREG